MNINWKEFISKEYWFGIDRVMMHLTDRIILYAALAFVVIAVVAIAYSILTKNSFLKKVAKDLSAVFATVGILEIIWYVLREQYVVALGTRFAAALVLLVGIVWLYFPLRYLVTRYRTDMAQASAQALKDKYLARPAK